MEPTRSSSVLLNLLCFFPLERLLLWACHTPPSPHSVNQNDPQGGELLPQGGELEAGLVSALNNLIRLPGILIVSGVVSVWFMVTTPRASPSLGDQSLSLLLWAEGIEQAAPASSMSLVWHLHQVQHHYCCGCLSSALALFSLHCALEMLFTCNCGQLKASLFVCRITLQMIEGLKCWGKVKRTEAWLPLNKSGEVTKWPGLDLIFL